ncbi:MAG: hypothetical protein WD600_07980 [Pseudohongiella sp.]
MFSWKNFAIAGVFMGCSHALWAEQASVVLRDNVLTIPGAVVVEGDTVSHYRNIELTQDAAGRFTIAAVEDGSLANIESVEIQQEAGSVEVLAKGYRSACVSILPEAVSYQDGKFVIAIPESKPTSEVCILAVVMFEVATTLDTDDLPAGEYTLVVNNVKKDFTL